MAKGLLVGESLRVGASLENLGVGRIRRVQVGNATSDQPQLWTLIDFEVPDARVEAFTEALAGELAQGRWYVDLHTAGESFIVFPGRVWRYARGDKQALAQVQAYARELGIPESQLDWQL